MRKRLSAWPAGHAGRVWWMRHPEPAKNARHGFQQSFSNGRPFLSLSLLYASSSSRASVPRFFSVSSFSLVLWPSLIEWPALASGSLLRGPAHSRLLSPLVLCLLFIHRRDRPSSPSARNATHLKGGRTHAARRGQSIHLSIVSGFVLLFSEPFKCPIRAPL